MKNGIMIGGGRCDPGVCGLENAVLWVVCESDDGDDDGD